MTQEGLYFWLASAKRNKRFESRTTSAHSEDFITEACAGIGIDQIASSVFFEHAICISRQHLRPFVTVIASRIASAKNVGEAVREAIPCWRHDNGDLVADLIQQLQRRLVPARIEIKMDAH